MFIRRNENSCILRKCTFRDLLRLPGQRGRSIDLLFYSLVIIDSPGELGSAWRSLRQARLLIEYSKDLTTAPLQGPVLLCGSVKKSLTGVWTWNHDLVVSNITRNPKLVGAFAFVGFLFYMKNTNSKYSRWSYGEGSKDTSKLSAVIDCSNWSYM